MDIQQALAVTNTLQNPMKTTFANSGFLQSTSTILLDPLNIDSNMRSVGSELKGQMHPRGLKEIVLRFIGSSIRFKSKN